MVEPEPQLFHTILFLSDVLSGQAPPSSMRLVLELAGVALLLFSSALISGAEVAFFSLTPADIKQLEESPTSTTKTILRLRQSPKTLLATILISNNFINIAIVLLSFLALNQLLPEERLQVWVKELANNDNLSLAVLNRWTAVISFSISVVGVTFLLVLFGEVVPKVYAKINNIRLAKTMAKPLDVLLQIFKPISWVLVSSTSRLEERLKRNGSMVNSASREEIGEAIDLTVSHEQDAAQEVDILKSIVHFGDVTVTQIMCSRVDMVAIDKDITFSEVVQVVKKYSYSRIPVYDGDIDEIIGVFYAKDLLGHLNEPADFDWTRLMRKPVLFVPESKKIDDLLKQFQQERLHMAIVVDEYGGSSGLVTLEDIMEEIIGEIKDEFDQGPEVDYKRVNDFTYEFEGKTLLNDFCRVIGIGLETFEDDRGESDSIAGLFLEIHGQLPQVDTEIKLKDISFKVLNVNTRRIEKILVTLPQ